MRLKRLLLLMVLPFIGVNVANAQFSVSVKGNPQYIWGEGAGTTLKAADRQALDELVSQVSMFVQSEGSIEISNVQGATGVQTEQKYENVMKTYSFAELHSVERAVAGEEPDVKVIRYIKKSEIDRIFTARIDKIKAMVRVGNNAYHRGQLGEALRYYYWSSVLLESVRNRNEVMIVDDSERQHVASVWLNERINTLLSSITCSFVKKQDENLYELAFLSDGKPIANLDFTYYDGSDWSGVTGVLDGQAVIELRSGYNTRSLQVRIEYQYNSDAQSDREVAQVIDLMETSFPRSQIKVQLGDDAVKTEAVTAVKKVQSAQPIATEVVAADAATSSQCNTSMLSIISAIKSRNYASVRKLFTDYGYNVFDTLVHIGNARIVGEPKLSYSKVGDDVVCRSVPMQFSYSRGRRFMEDVAFVFDKSGLVDNVMYGLGKIATNDICTSEIPDCSDYAKQVLVSFLENYKTAFAMKRIDYIERLFADDALIITGRVLKKYTGKLEGLYQNNKYIQQTRQTKVKYIKNLKNNFKFNEFINIKFANTDLRKFPSGGEIYAVQVKQDYFSSSYGDSGYLFLLVDVNNPEQPIIHVRSWQEQPDRDWGLVDEYKF